MSEKISKISVDNVVYDLSVDMSSVDAKVSELENKISEGDAGLQENIDNLAEKVESEATRVDGMVNQINENVASSIETLNNNLVQAIETINGGIAAEVTNREEGDKALQASIDELAEKINGESGDLSELEGKVEKNAADIATVNSNLVEAVNNINKNMADGFNTINGGINDEIRPELEKAVKYEDTATEQNPGRKTIFLNNHDNICGKTTDGGSVNIAMVSKWNKVDLGSTAIELNLNGSAEHPTYNDSKEIAFLEDVQGSMETIALVKKDDLTYELQVGDKIAGTINIPADQFLKSVEYSADDKSLTFVFNTAEGEQTSVVDLSSLVDTYVAGLSNTLEALNATVQILQSKVDVLTKTNTEVVSVDGSAGELKDSSKDYIVSGSINENAEIVGKSISLKSIKVSDNARLKLNAGDVEAKDLNISGSFPKANGNTVISVNNAEFIVFKDMVFDASEVYNGIEIGLASNSVFPKNILFDNCKFQGEFSNNAILVFGTQDNAIITLNNCYFEKISNALRISNKMNAKGVVVNINNCTVDQWDTRVPWQGFLILEDYTSKSDEEALANNLFAPEKITINFNNLVYQGKKVMPEDVASVCGTKDENQVVYVCIDSASDGNYVVAYDKNRYPTINFN